MKPVLWMATVALLGTAPAYAQDAAAVDPKHYKVEMENEQVRVLRIHYGPGEKSVMHSHPASVAVFLTEGKVKFTTPDGKTQEAGAKSGEVQWEPGGSHLPENVGTKPFDLILVELKSAPAK
jgi:quercetin dioxygenase-like cupin family protein